ncbi:M23 family metallopeptidase [Leptospira interrogans]|uniref:M23 family metallopeptidase n=1 Tax=Leptospira interrogans TaxID=173 RepID=UPI0002B9386B|nr:M23 family metallopeptidase [Leptospira interrogans]MCR8647686.1 peptidase M23 [Leptospira interrogans serovar Bataviae]OAM85444.1 peptidase M23 [Leptospira interrogans serovar Bataviae]QOI36870.1 M23 family metallopeptidase [Leptospira interrogans serovar Bataviae]QOI38360.1 M23 family metallopeptidase [Leptospira interrogans serovar Bataviae]QYY60465.1 M23 family metallopeptidase [Leptospira interrogans serovar Bataviae]
MSQILDFLKSTSFEVQKYFMNFEEIQKKQNYWNDSVRSKIKTERIGQEAVRAHLPVFSEVVDPVFICPVNEPHITSPFGWRTLNINGKPSKQFHLGIDLGGEREIKAPEDCIIKTVLTKDKEFPVRFRHKEGTWVDLISTGKIPAGRAWTPYIIAIGVHTKNQYKFKHVDSYVSIGQNVKAGTVIGRSGNLGYSMGPHLHFEVWPWNENKQSWPTPMDPAKFLKSKNLI